jgi:hypothetical protein
MKILLGCLVTFFLTQSCQTKNERAKPFKSILKNCDQPEIVYYNNDTFTYKIIDTSEIKLFTELISGDNERLAAICQTTGQLIYKCKGQQIFTADLSMENFKDSISCNYVTYFLKSDMYRHRLTYRTGMSIDEIYYEENKKDSSGIHH